MTFCTPILAVETIPQRTFLPSAMAPLPDAEAFPANGVYEQGGSVQRAGNGLCRRWLAYD